MQEMRKIYMMSYYKGLPKVGIPASTGTFTIWEDRITFDKVLGNGVGNVSLIGMVLARKKAMKEGKTEVFQFSDIRRIIEGKYMGFMPMLTLEMNSGEQHSFSGTVFSAAECAALIKKLRPQIQVVGLQAETPAVPSTPTPVPPVDTSGGNADEAGLKVFYFEGEFTGKLKDSSAVGTLALTDEALQFTGRRNGETVSARLPYVDIRTAREASETGGVPRLEVLREDGAQYHFAAQALDARRMAELIMTRVGDAKHSDGSLPDKDDSAEDREAKRKVVEILKKVQRTRAKEAEAAPARICAYCGHVYEPGDDFCAECGGVKTK